MTTPLAVCPSCLEAREDISWDQHTVLRPLLPALLPWLTTRRWFAHESGCLTGLEPVRIAPLHADSDGALLLALLEADHSGGARHTYQVLLRLRPSLPAALSAAAFGRATGGRWDGWWLLDATEDPESMQLLLRVGAEPTADVRLALTPTAAREQLDRLSPRLLAVEQSNSSVVYGDRAMLKLIRNPQPGVHPEAEVLTALTALGSSSSARLLGTLTWTGPDGTETVLGVLTDFLANRGDGWKLAVEQATDCMTGACRTVPAIGGFTAEARALGIAVAHLHGDMAAAFGSKPLTTQEILDQTAQMEARVREAAAEVPGLEPYINRLIALYDDYAMVALRGRGVPAQRVHGDLHLGQVLRTADGWKVIDFEGEPSKSIAERSAPQPAFRDVAGMLRSFDYAAQQALVQVRRTEVDADDPDGPNSSALRMRQSRRAFAWNVRNRRAFNAGYAEGGGADPACHPVMLRALEADKAVYEALYEARHRPAWLPIPIAAVNRAVCRY